MARRREQRAYPMACRSLYCGETSCPATCPELPELQAFKAWRDRTRAQPISQWHPCIYEGVTEEPGPWPLTPVPSTIPLGFASQWCRTN
jgi:hypothetical protein